MTPQQYRKLGKQYERMEAQLKVLEHKQDAQVETLALQHQRAEHKLKKKWAKKLNAFEKRMKHVENQIDHYEHA